MAVSLISTGLSGEVANAGQPAFNVKINANNNTTGGNHNWPGSAGEAANNVNSTENYDIGSDAVLAEFTAPVTGKYFLNAQLTITGMTDNQYYGFHGISTSNRGYTLNHSYDWYHWFHPGAAWVAHVNGSVLTDMDADDEAYQYCGIYGDGQVVDFELGYFMGGLVF